VIVVVGRQVSPLRRPLHGARYQPTAGATSRTQVETAAETTRPVWRQERRAWAGDGLGGPDVPNDEVNVAPSMLVERKVARTAFQPEVGVEG